MATASDGIRAPRPKSLPAKVARELGTFARLARGAARPRVWVLGQKKTGTSLAASFVSEGLFGRPAAIDLPVRRWLQRWLLPYLFERRPRVAVELIARILRQPVVKEPNLCYHVRELVGALDPDATIVYVTRDRVAHVRSFLDRILERRGEDIRVRPDLNFVWRAYVDGMPRGARVRAADLDALIVRLGKHFDAVDGTCLEAIASAPCASVVIRYEDVVRRAEPLERALSARWPTFDWERAGRALGVQHQPRGARVVDERLIARLLGG